MTRRDFENTLNERIYPKPVTLDEALASDDPVDAILIRLAHCPDEEMTPAERQLFCAGMFLGDTLNGGLEQCLLNSTGDYFEEVRQFAVENCSDAVVEILDQVATVFPEGVVPATRAAREDYADALFGEHAAAMDSLTSAFYEREDDFRDGMSKLLQRRAAEFVWQSRIRVDPDS